LAQRMWPGESAIGQRFVGDPHTTGGGCGRRRATRWGSWSAPRCRPACWRRKCGRR
jgi:hypothetical protein